MSLKFGVKLEALSDTIIQEIGPSPSIFIEEIEKIEDGDSGSFYLITMIGKWETKTKTMLKGKASKYLQKFKTKCYTVMGHVSKDELDHLVWKYGIELTQNVEVIEEGWLGRSYGLIQVLWERGMIN